MNLELRTSDEKTFKASMELLRYSGTLKYMVEVCGIQNSVVPLPRVSSKILEKLLDWVNHQEEMRLGANVPMDTGEVPSLPTDLTINICPGMLFHLIFTANFLGHDVLLENLMNSSINWMEQNPLNKIADSVEKSCLTSRIEEAIDCLIPKESNNEIRDKLSPFAQKVERALKPLAEELLAQFQERGIARAFESFDASDAHELYEDTKKIMKFLRSQFSDSNTVTSLEETFKENKTDWAEIDFVKISLTQTLREIDDDLNKAEKELDIKEIGQFLQQFNFSRATSTVLDMLQTLISFCSDLGRNSIIANMTNSKTLGSILTVSNQILLNEIFNTAFENIAYYVKEPNLLKGLGKLAGNTALFSCQSIPQAQVVKLQTSNGNIFNTNVKIGECQEIIKIFLKIMNIDENGIVCLPYINTMVFEKILCWANYYKATNSLSIYESGLSRWEARYLRVDMQTLFEIIWAADYLDIPDLLDAACKAVGISIIGPSPNEIIEIVKMLPDILFEFYKMYERHFYLYT